MRVVAGFVVICLLGLACMTTAPTPNPTSTASPAPTPTEKLTDQPSPTVGPTTDTGLPTSILGLPVYTVAGIRQLAARGALDGRFAAVAGYWAQYAYPCPYTPHQAPLSGFCYGGEFGDTPESVGVAGGPDGRAPLTVTETSWGNVLWHITGGPAGPSAQVALIVHAGDARSWQCDPAQRQECASRLVIDRVAWANDEELGLDQPDPNGPPGNLQMTLDEVIAAAAGQGDTAVLAYPIDAGSLNDVDPRFIGQGEHNVWYVRLISGPADADGIAPGKDVLVDDATGTVVTTMPLAVDPGYQPARIVLDSKGWDGGNGPRPVFTVGNADGTVAQGWLDSSSTPMAIEPADYTVHGFIGPQGRDPVFGRTCNLQLTLAVGDDVAYYADWPERGDCTWKEGAWPFN